MNKISISAIGLLMATYAFSANATMSVFLDDGTTTSTVTDNGAGDAVGWTDWVTTFEDFGSDVWQVQATGKSQSGDTWDLLHFDSVAASSTGTGVLTIKLTQTDLDTTGLDGNWITGAVGGVSRGDMQFQLWADETNTGFGEGTLLYNSLSENNGATFSGGDFGDDYFGSLGFASDSYSLTMVATLSHSTETTSSFNFDIRVPEPSSLALLGIGLIGLGFGTRRKINKTA